MTIIYIFDKKRKKILCAESSHRMIMDDRLNGYLNNKLNVLNECIKKEMWLRKRKNKNALLLILFILLLSQLFFAVFMSRYRFSPKFEYHKTFHNTSFKNYFPFDIEFPVVSKVTKMEDVEWAENFLNIPKWSQSYVPCNSSESEYSCFELFNAAKTLKNYESKYENNELNGKITVNITKQNFGDIFTMLYHACIIGMYTNRMVYLKSEKEITINLPKIIKRTVNASGIPIDTSYNFSCYNFSIPDDLVLSSFSWPQALYTHSEMGQYLRSHFSFHAAYFIGHYILGEYNYTDLKFKHPTTVIEYWKFNDISNILANSYFVKIAINLLNLENYTYATNDWNFLRNMNGIALIENNNYYNLIKFLDAKKFIFTMGSRFGYWVNALRASKVSSYINVGGYTGIYNLSVSQAGSLFPIYLGGFYDDPITKEVQGVNSYLYTCGDNSYDVKLYINYLLW